jgi:hypothetical protein
VAHARTTDRKASGAMVRSVKGQLFELQKSATNFCIAGVVTGNPAASAASMVSFAPAPVAGAVASSEIAHARPPPAQCT